MRVDRLGVVIAASALGAVVVCACGFDGQGSAVPLDAAGGGRDTGSPTTGGDDASEGTDAGPTIDANVDIGPSSTCKEVLARDPSTAGKSGIYGPDLHCDMVTDSGGWTLVGRSVKDGKGVFGWRSRAGSVGDLTKPYSKDVVGSGLVFSEVMISDSPAIHVYKLTVAADFLTAHANDRTRSGTVITLAGECTPTGLVSMLKFTGQTAFTDTFFFRDIDDAYQHRGLQPDGWDLAYGNCEQGVSLDAKQGAIFVR